MRGKHSKLLFSSTRSSWNTYYSKCFIFLFYSCCFVVQKFIPIDQATVMEEIIDERNVEIHKV